jgi:transcriptional regulator with XRE-family HTH domain
VVTSEEFKVVLGKKIRALRKLCGHTQMELAEHLGFTSTGAISQVESGSKGLTAENIQKLAELFEVHASVLFTPMDMDERDLRMMRVLYDRIKNKNKDPQKRQDYELISRLVASVA